MPIRRHCDPINVKRLWDAIRSANLAHQPCDVARILKYLQKNGNFSQGQVELYLKQAVKDGLILPTKKTTTEITNPTYKITDQELPEFDEKDWYCFECHLAGEVTTCSTCFRVFHPDCIKGAKRKFDVQRNSTSLRFNNTSTTSLDNSIQTNDLSIDIPTDDSMMDKSIADYIYDETLCSVCNIINIDNCKLDRDELNYLLKFVLHRVRAWLPHTITHTMAQEDRPNWLTDSELTWRANQLFFEHRDMSVIEVNLNSEMYTIFSEFLADVLTVQHNVAIFHGIESQEYQAAELMVRDTLHDITELKNCSDCYKHSNEKIHTRWFTLPCRNSHKLVWAKQKGYPYWPAKVIKETLSHSDVRFFGGKHERSLIHKSFVKPITVSKQSLKIKESSAFVKAYEELIYHQKLLSDPQELERLKADSKTKRVLKKTISPIATPLKVPKKRGRAKVNESVESISPGSHTEPPSVSNSTRTIKCVESIDGLKNTPIEMSQPILVETLDIPSHSQAKKPKNEQERTSSEVISGNVIDISDCEDEETDYSFRGNNISQEPFRLEDRYEQVTSSTGNCPTTTQDVGLHQLDQPYSDSVEKMRRQLESLPNKPEIIKIAMDCMQAEIDKITNDHNEHLKRLFESHNAQISETKKKQWCYNCEQDAIYHCCWNTAYCSQTCQQQHWQAEHKKVCRRKRQN